MYSKECWVRETAGSGCLEPGRGSSSAYLGFYTVAFGLCEERQAKICRLTTNA